jgi:hypothetical protein
MHKKGDIRDDGRVFYAKNKSSIGGEYWMEMDQFLRTCGQDYYERIAAHQKYLAEMKSTKAVRELKKRERRIERYHKTKHLTVAKRKDAREKSHAKMLLDPVRLEKHKAKCNRLSKRYQEKQKLINAEKKAKRETERELLKKIKQEQAKAKRIERERASEEKALAKSLRPERVFLTTEQRKENKRQGKRNYKHVRRARINNCEIKATPKIVEEARKNAGDRCYYCGQKCNLTLDHFEPLSKGGAHCVSNFVFCCFLCNSRKRDLDPFKFMASNPAIDFSSFS